MTTIATPASEQLDLDIGSRSRAPRVSQADVDGMIDKLRGQKDWMTAEMLGFATEAQKRRLRRIKQVSRGKIISFPGSPGYKLLDHCTLAELRRCDAAVRSQTRKMEEELKPVWRRMHKLELVETEGASAS